MQPKKTTLLMTEVVADQTRRCLQVTTIPMLLHCEFNSFVVLAYGDIGIPMGKLEVKSEINLVLVNHAVSKAKNLKWKVAIPKLLLSIMDGLLKLD